MYAPASRTPHSSGPGRWTMPGSSAILVESPSTNARRYGNPAGTDEFELPISGFLENAACLSVPVS